ncbi:MAG: hypothetical protein WBO34_14555 [Gammaproteobacteria bacterium]
MKYFVPLVVLLILHVVFLLLDAYSMSHLDSVLHLAGGVALGIFIYGVFTCAVSKGWCPDPGRPVTLILVVALVTTGAVCWEFYEWISDTVFGTHLQLTVADTIKDLLLGLLGGLLYAVYSLIANPDGKRGIASRSECRPLRSKG